MDYNNNKSYWGNYWGIEIIGHRRNCNLLLFLLNLAWFLVNLSRHMAALSIIYQFSHAFVSDFLSDVSDVLELFDHHFELPVCVPPTGTISASATCDL